LIDAALRPAGGRRRTLEFEGLPNLVADWGGADDDRRLILAGHTGVVPAEGEWETAPFSLVRQGDSLIGRGVCDMKGALAAYVGALEALEMAVSDERFDPWTPSLTVTAVRVDGEPAINTIPDAVWLSVDRVCPPYIAAEGDPLIDTGQPIVRRVGRPRTLGTLAGS
jgi:hypothetical protein